MKRLLGVTLLAAVLTAALSAQWQMLARIDGADVGRLYQSPSGVLYVQLASGMKIFRSYDGGILWSPLELPSAANQAGFAHAQIHSAWRRCCCLQMDSSIARPIMGFHGMNFHIRVEYPKGKSSQQSMRCAMGSLSF